MMSKQLNCRCGAGALGRVTVAFIALIVVTAGTFSPPWSPLASQLHEPPSRCHEHGKEAPARGYDCCLNGHNVAIPRAFSSVRPAVRAVTDLAPARTTTTDSFSTDRSPLTQCAHPPSSTPLRI